MSHADFDVLGFLRLHIYYACSCSLFTWLSLQDVVGKACSKLCERSFED